LLEAGASSTVVGVLTPAGEPFATRGWALRVLQDDPVIIDVLLPTGSVTRAGIGPGSADFAIAVTVADVRTLRAVQLKGRATSVVTLPEDDLPRLEAYADAFCQAVHEMDGTPYELLRRMQPVDTLLCSVAVDSLFDQTPGPGAGAPLERA
jgi:hypothetical protein